MMNKATRLAIISVLMTLALTGLAIAATPVVTVDSLFGIKAKENKVTWNAAMNKVCRQFDWVTKPSFSRCKAFAIRNNLLTPPLPNKIALAKKLTRVQLETFFNRARDLKAGNRPSAPEIQEQQTPIPPREDNTTIPTRRLPEKNFLPVAAGTTDVTFFKNIRLSQPLPHTFYLDEVYMLEGDVINTSAESTFVFLCKPGNCSSTTNFVEPTVNNHFRIPVYFNEAGNFQLGIIPGRSGESKIISISVLPEQPLMPATGTMPTQLTSSYSNGKTTLGWSGASSTTPLQIVFFQGAVRKDYYFRTPVNSFVPPSSHFGTFHAGALRWFVMSGTSQSEARRENAVIQEFKKISDSEITVQSLRETFSNPGTLQFSGRSVKTVSKKAAITLPNGTVEEKFFTESDVGPGGAVELSVQLSTAGTYIFELNNPEGAAVVNVPVYVGDVFPILPDFFTAHPAKLSTEPLGDLTSERLKMLQLINADRAAQKLPPVAIDGALNGVAQGHSENMKTKNFFGHRDPAGRSPDDRRRAALVPTGIRENLGKAVSLELVEAGLMRSPVHRDALVDPRMKRVGIGIAKTNEGYFLVTQNFSGDPLTPSSLIAERTSLVQQISSYRIQKSLTALPQNTTIAEIATNWSERMAGNNFFGLTDTAGDTLANQIRARHIVTSVKIHLIKTSDIDLLDDELFKQSSMNDSTLHNIGIGLGVSDVGDIYMTTLYTP